MEQAKVDLAAAEAERADAVEEMAMARTVMRVQDNTLDWLATQQADEVVEQDRLAGVRREIAGLLAEAGERA